MLLGAKRSAMRPGIGRVFGKEVFKSKSAQADRADAGIKKVTARAGTSRHHSAINGR